MLLCRHPPSTCGMRAAGGTSRRPLLVHASSQQRSLHICTNKTCRRQGSQQILKFTQDLGLEELDVQECGCLGNCGKGPNMVLMPGEVRLRHVSTPADMLGVLKSLSIDIEPAALQATEALELKPSKGQHMLYSNLSAAFLQLGQQEAALAAAKASVELAPKGFHMAHVRYVDALYASAKFDEAAAALHEAVARDHNFKSIPEYKMMEQALRKYMPKVKA